MNYEHLQKETQMPLKDTMLKEESQEGLVQILRGPEAGQRCVC